MGSNPPPPPHWSPDYHYWWTGTEWVMPRRSEDGRYFWDGSQWLPDPRAALAQPEGWRGTVRPGPHERFNLASGLYALGILVAVVVGYVVWHYFVYRNCIFPPSLFDWPSACI
jgi:hypothetical protein